MATTGIRAEYILVTREEQFQLLRRGTIIVRDGVIVFVGNDFSGDVDHWIDAGNTLVTPGFINLHTHPISTPVNRSLREEESRTSGYFALPFWIRLYDLMGPEDERVLSRYAMWELLRKGTTTALLMTTTFPEVVAEEANRIGIRAYISPSYREANWDIHGPYRRKYDWNVQRGRRALERSLEFIDRHNDPKSRIRGFLGPEQVDTCSPELLRETARLAEELDVGVTVHASQSDMEYEHIREKHGMSPIELLDHTRLLGDRTIIAHCIHTSSHSSVQDPSRDDLNLLASTSTNVAHCPWCFARRGVIMESLYRYRYAGINVGLGTDVAPQDIIQEMRWAAVLSRVHEGDGKAPDAQQAIAHATTSGATALRREDLGSIAPGQTADLLFFDLDQLDLGPVRDPVRTLMYSIDGHNVTSVMVDGELVVENQQVRGIEENALRQDVQRVCERVWSRIPEIADGKALDDITPMLVAPVN